MAIWNYKPTGGLPGSYTAPAESVTDPSEFKRLLNQTTSEFTRLIHQSPNHEFTKLIHQSGHRIDAGSSPLSGARDAPAKFGNANSLNQNSKKFGKLGNAIAESLSNDAKLLKNEKQILDAARSSTSFAARILMAFLRSARRSIPIMGLISNLLLILRINQHATEVAFSYAWEPDLSKYTRMVDCGPVHALSACGSGSCGIPYPLWYCELYPNMVNIDTWYDLYTDGFGRSTASWSGYYRRNSGESTWIKEKRAPIGEPLREPKPKTFVDPETWREPTVPEMFPDPPFTAVPQRDAAEKAADNGTVRHYGASRQSKTSAWGNRGGGRRPPGPPVEDSPPGPGVRERKFRAPGWFMRAVEEAWGLTEAVDLVNILYDNLPESVKKATPATGVTMRGARIGEGKKYVSVMDKARALFAHINEIDVPSAFKDLLINQITDRIVGGVHAGADKGLRKMGVSHGTGVTTRGQW